MRRGAQTAHVKDGSSSVTAITFSRDGQILAAAGQDGAIRLWSPTTGTLLGRLSVGGETRAIAFSPDGKSVAAVDFFDGAIRIWSLATRKPIARIVGRDDASEALAFSRDGTTIAAAGSRAIRRWNVASGRPRAPVTRITNPGAVAFSQDASVVAAVDADGVDLWRPATGRRIAHIADRTPNTAMPNVVYEAAFSPDDSTLASVELGTIRLWSVAARRQLPRLTPTDGVSTIAFSPDGATIASTASALLPGEGHGIGLWNPDARDRFSLLAGSSAVNASDIAFSPDGRTLASAAPTFRGVRRWNAATGARVAPLGADTTIINAVDYSRDAKTLAAAGEDGTIRFWNTSTSKGAVLRTGDDAGTQEVALSPDGRLAASTGINGTVRVFQRAVRRQLALLPNGGPGSVQRLAFAPDGKTLAYGDDGSLRLWSTTTHKQVGRLAGSSAVRGIAFSPDGGRVAVAADDGTISLWSPATRGLLRRISAHEGAVSDIAFSPDGKMLASAGDDGTVRLWDPVSGAALGRVNRTMSSTREPGTLLMAFAPNGRTLAVGEPRGIRLYRDILWHTVGQLHATVCDVLLTGVSRSDWQRFAPGIAPRRSCP